MNILLIVIGSLLLIVPNISFFDILPDFIGYILIMTALKKSSYICYDIKDARSMFRNLVWTNALRIPFYIVFLLLSRDTTLLLLFNFIFSAFEAFFLLRGFSKLFTGFSYLALREDNDGYDFAETDKTAAVFKNMSNIKALTLIFIIIRAACALLPDLSVLSSTEYGTVTAGGIASVSRYHAIFAIAGFVISLVFGIVWFISFKKYLDGVKADKTYINGIDAKYGAFVEKDPFAIVKDALFLFMMLLTAGAVFSLGLRLDGINLIPQFVGGAFFLAAVITIRKYNPKQSKKPILFSALYMVISIVSWVYQYVFIRSFFSAFLDSDEVGLAESYSVVLEMYLSRSFTVIYQFIGSIAVSVVEGAILIILVISLSKLLKEIINEHTGNVIQSYEEDKKDDDASVRTTASLLRLLKVSTVIGILSAAVSAAQSFLCIPFPAIWIFELVLKAAWIVMVVILISRTMSSVKQKYYL